MQSSETSTTATPRETAAGEAHSCDATGSGRTTEGVDFVRHTVSVAWKDLRVEFRSGEIIWNMTFFAAVVVLIFSFAFIRDGKMDPELTPGIIWVALAFAGTLGLSRAFDREREGDTMRGLLLSPAPRTAIFFGKALSVVILVSLVAFVVVPLAAVLFGAPLFDHALPFFSLLILGIVGIGVVGSVFAAMLLRARARDVLLPVMLYPILVPLLLIGTQATALLVAENPDPAGAWRLARFLGAYDLIFLVFSLWIFEATVIE